jgi:hypothetical protein
VSYDNNGVAEPEYVTLWEPHPGPQTEFLQSDAYEVLYGGAAGGGKTDCLMAWLVEDTEIPSTAACSCVRRTPR